MTVEDAPGSSQASEHTMARLQLLAVSKAAEVSCSSSMSTATSHKSILTGFSTSISASGRDNHFAGDSLEGLSQIAVF